MKKIDIDKLGKVVFISPHDDDCIIGCGGLLSKLKNKKYVIVMTDGSLGYSNLEQKHIIERTRRKESKKAYGLLETEPIFLDFPDMSLNAYKCWKTSDGKEGGYQKLLRTLRKIKPDTLFIPNLDSEHPDHQAANDIASVCSFQLQEHVAVDLGEPVKLSNIFIYKVRKKLEKSSHLIKLDNTAQEVKKKVLSEFRSQKEILNDVDIEYRKEEFKLL